MCLRIDYSLPIRPVLKDLYISLYILKLVRLISWFLVAMFVDYCLIADKSGKSLINFNNR